MSYATDTILVRDAPRANKFDRLRVVGPSPIRTSNVAAEWGGGHQADLFICQPLAGEEFSGVEIIPQQALSEHYSIEFEPDVNTHYETAPATRPVRRLSAEEQFRLAAKQAVPVESARKRTPIRVEK